MTTSIQLTTLYEYINVVSNNKLTWYIQQNKTKEEEEEYYASDNYKLHLNYLIETWVSIIENNLIYFDIHSNIEFDCIKRGYYYSPKFKFNNDWLDDIFVRHILVTSAVCLK